MVNSLILICSFQALFLSVLVFLKRKKNHADNILAAWLLIIALHTLSEYLQSYNYDKGYPHPWLIGIDVTFSMLHPILVFLYILSFTRLTRRPRGYLGHFIPFLLVNLALIKPFYIRPGYEKIQEYNSIMNGQGYLNQTFQLITYAIMLIGIAYFIAGLVYIQRHRRNLRQQLSSVQGFELQWLKLLLMVMGGVFLVAVLLEFFSNTLRIISPEWGSAIVFVAMAMGIFYIGIHGILQTDYFSGYDPDLVRSGDPLTKAIRPKPEPVQQEETRQEQLELKYSQLIQYMESEKPFLETDLNLSRLAEMVGMKPHFLSMLINQMSDKNFFDFVNHFRIMEFKNQIMDPGNQPYTLIAIAYGCGFNSKTTFNRAFKNATGQTPSEFYHASTNRSAS